MGQCGPASGPSLCGRFPSTTCGMDNTRATDSPRWKQVVTRHLRTMRRCQCPELQWKLELLRSAKPSKEQLHRTLRGHRAMPDRGPGYSPEPTNMDMAAMLQQTPNTTFVAVTRRATAILNNLALEVLFAEAMPLGRVAVDPESNLENYDDRGRLMAMEPLHLPIFVGARVTLTKNIDKARDFVNGMAATVVGMKRSSVVVQTKTGQVLTVFPYRDEEKGEKMQIGSSWATSPRITSHRPPASEPSDRGLLAVTNGFWGR